MFSDLDDSERKLQKSVELMSSNELIEYCQLEYFRLFHGRLPLERQKDKGVVNRFIKKYNDDAGKIVKWIFYKYRGLDSSREPFRISLLSAGFEWYHLKMIEEIQADHQKEKEFVLKSSQSKWTKLTSLKGLK